MRCRLALLVALAGCPPAADPVLPERPCSVSPLELDFGEVETGRRSPTRTVTVRNDSPVLRVLGLAALEPPFFLEIPTNQLLVPAFGTKVFELGFFPRDGRLHLQDLVFTDELAREGDSKCELTLSLRGLGTGRVSVEPSELAFTLEPGEVETKELLIINSRRTPATVSALVQLRQSLAGGDPVTVDPTPVVVPAAGAVRLPVRAAPHAPDLVLGELLVSAEGEAPLRSRFSLRAGKPVAEVLPRQVIDWRVQYDRASQPASFSRRRLTLRNVGSSGTLPALALKLGQPAFTVEALQGSLAELVVLTGNQPLDGLAQGESAELVLHLWPLSVGPKEFRLRLFVDEPLDDPADPLDPVIEVMVRANAEVMPACTMTVEPASSLQLVEANGRLEGGITFTNTGATPCLVDDLHLASSTLPGYFIESGAAEQVEVLPGASYVIAIAGPVQSLARRVGALEHHIFNRDSRSEVVELLAP